MQISLISDSRKKLLIHLLEDSSYNKDILMDGDLPKTIVVQDDGSVLIGRTPKNWWNSLFPEDKRVIEFAMVAFRIAANLNKIAKPGKIGANLKRYLAQNIIEKAIDSRQYDLVVDMLLQAAMFGVTEGTFKSNYITDEDVEEASRRQASNKNAGKRNNGDTIPVHVVLDNGCGSFPIGSLFIEPED